MRVAVDARHLGAGRGVGNYTAEVLGALARGFPDDDVVPFVPRAAGARTIAGRAPSRLLFGAAAIAGVPRLDRLAGGADVVWLPAPAPVAVSREVPYVLTVHDLSWLERPADFTPYERLWHRLGRLERLAGRASVVVAVSEATKRAVAERWPRVERVEVVYSGIPSLPQERGRTPRLHVVGGGPSPFFLCVGALEPRKAPDVLARGFAEARRRGLDAELVFVGRGRLAGALRGEGVHVVEDADRALLAQLYDHALALALPSRLEGFGFTALEAARAGLPVLAAPVPVLDETLGDAALRVTDWPEALLRVAADAALRERLAAAGRAAAARFDWDETARRMHALLAEAAGR